jgi:hypothetical protein
MDAAFSQPYGQTDICPMPERQCFRQSEASLGAINSSYPLAHLARMGGLLAPLVIGELIKDPDKKWRWIRIASLVSAGVTELMWAQREQQRREQREHRHHR